MEEGEEGPCLRVRVVGCVPVCWGGEGGAGGDEAIGNRLCGFGDRVQVMDKEPINGPVGQLAGKVEWARSAQAVGVEW